MSNLGLGMSRPRRISLSGVNYMDQPLLETHGICQFDVGVELGVLNQPQYTIDTKINQLSVSNPGLSIDLIKIIL